MNILHTIERWFGVDHDGNEIAPALPNTGQQAYRSQTADTDVQAQVTPVELNPIPVDICGIVPTWSMPSKHQIIGRSQQGNNTVQDLIDGDYKYKRVTLWISFAVNTQSTGVFVGDAKSLAQGVGGGSVWGAELPLYFPVVLEGLTRKISFLQTQASITANGALSVNYIAERWAD